MTETVKQVREEEYRVRNFGAWRNVVSAWAIMVLVFVLFAGVEALASRHHAAPHPHHPSFAGVVIPRHDPVCAGPGLLGAAAGDQCHASSAPLDPAGADAYVFAGW
jgi:hypothetical protein